jgi:hypothetical protein
MPTTAPPSLAALLSAPLAVAEPDVAGPLAVFPVLGGPPALEYTSFAEGASHGVKASELPQASVNDLLIDNPTGLPVLLYEGEELLGAQQNRTVDHAVLVPARSKLTVPVSCVEHGRWDGRRHGEAFRDSDQAAYPELRRQKNRHMRARLAQGLEARADQSQVWEAVSDKASRLGAASPTEAMSDIYDQRRDRIGTLRAAVARRDGQLGALVAIGGRFTVLDAVSRPDVFAALHAPLVAGYALDALEHESPTAAAPSRDAAEAFLAQALAQPARRARAVGLGEALHFAGAGVGGTGLAVDGELVQLCAYAEEADTHRASRIRRPSRRH